MVYDPAALGNAQKVLGDSVSYAESAAQLARACDVIVIVTAWDEFRNLSADDLHTGGRRKAIIDCWRILDSHRLAPVADIVYLGHGDVAALPVSMR